MEVSFKFNAGETGQEMVAAILALFGATPAAISHAAAPQAGLQAAQTISPADNPAAGAGDDDAGQASAATHDTEGTPWDARIHSDKRTVTDKGVWRKRKSTPPTTINAVMAELRAAGKILAPAGAAPAQPPAMPPAAPAATLTPPALNAMPAMPPTPQLAVPQETAYQKLVDFIAQNLNTPANPAGRFTTQWVGDAIKNFGYVGPDGNGHLQLLEAVEADKVKAIHAAFGQAIGVAIA